MSTNEEIGELKTEIKDLKEIVQALCIIRVGYRDSEEEKFYDDANYLTCEVAHNKKLLLKSIAIQKELEKTKVKSELKEK